ncbi:LysR family transcriptional regulator [Paraburkholderia sp. J12]|uniref:LysR family transcriptional regulator n=1 Tax=Paraburkholderia sp. J12 TaxID=2805432 RepID=UPI002ABD3B6F|nr:LysR family transcriptional regulator [Paraburkholderia sp. J12]
MDSLNGFVVFVQVAQTRSFVAAGRLLGVSASAVGKSVARLEDKLGVRLFYRSTRSVTLTAEGTRFLERSRRILAEIEAAQTEISEATARPRGPLRVSLPLVSSLLLPVLGEFMREYPEIELDLDFTDRVVDVIEEGFDAVVRTGVPTDSRLAARKLGSFRWCVVASPQYFERRGTPQVPADLLDHTCLHYRVPNTGKLETWALRRASGEPELTLPVSMICNNIDTRVCFALQGRGIAYLPDFSIRTLLEDGQLRVVLCDHVEREGVFHVLWPASKHPSPKVRVLVDFLGEHVFPATQACDHHGTMRPR